jgi:hypothetical protein
LGNFYGKKEAVPAAREGFDEVWMRSIISQRGPNLVDSEIDAAFEIDEGIASPDVLMNLVPGDDLPCPLGKHQQHSELLRLELD